MRPNGAPGKPLRILLVEDSPLLRSRLENMLSQHAAFKVTGLAAAEAEAVEKLDTVPYDAIVVDVELRPGSGIGVIRQARARNKDDGDGGHVWIIVLTNYDLPTVRERCMAGRRRPLPRQDARDRSAHADPAADRGTKALIRLPCPGARFDVEHCRRPHCMR